MRANRTILLLSMAICASWAVADDWGPPPRKWTSENGQFALVRNDEPVRSPRLTLVDVRGKPKTVWEIQSPQEAPPYEVHISPDGRSVVLEEEWGRLGSGVTLAFLGPKGKTLKTYRLEEVLPGSEILDAPHTVSSIWWKKSGLSFFRPNGRHYALISNAGTVRLYDLVTGNRVRPSPGEERLVLVEAAKLWRPKLADPEMQFKAIGHLVVVKDSGSSKAIMKLMRAAEPEYRPSIGYHLGILLGDEFSPEIESQIKASESTAREWFLLFGDGPQALAAMRRIYAADPRFVEEQGSRFFAHAGAAQVRKHPQWLSAKDKEIRYGALVSLAREPLAADQPLLERALADPDDTNVLLATRGLIKLGPPNLRTTLSKLAEKSGPMYGLEARVELARLGDKRWQSEIFAGLEGPLVPGRTPYTSVFLFRAVCEMLSEAKLPGTDRLLAPYAAHSRKDWSIPANGALACLGDAAAQVKTRAQANEGYFLDRLLAIEWLVRSKDRSALSLLRLALSDDDPEVVEAARVAIAKVNS